MWGLFVLLWTVGYFGNAVHSWFGDVWKVSEYQGLDATTFLEQDFPSGCVGDPLAEAEYQGLSCGARG